MLEISVKKRDQLKKKAKGLLKEGYIPAVLYGPKLASKPIAVKYSDFENTYNEAGETNLVSLMLADDKSKEVALIKEPQYDVETRKIIHVDFYQPPLDKKTEVEIPINIVGEAPIVQQGEGVLMTNLHEISISALPSDLINEIKVDISSMDSLDSTITVEDLKVPEGIEILDEPSTVITFIEEPVEEEQIEEAGESESEEDAIADIKTEGEEKREEKEEEVKEEKSAGDKNNQEE